MAHVCPHGWTFYRSFNHQHHFARFYAKVSASTAILLYLLVLIAIALPWAVFLASALVGAKRWHWRGKRTARSFARLWARLDRRPNAFLFLSDPKLPALYFACTSAAALLVEIE